MNSSKFDLVRFVNWYQVELNASQNSVSVRLEPCTIAVKVLDTNCLCKTEKESSVQGKVKQTEDAPFEELHKIAGILLIWVYLLLLLYNISLTYI